MIPHEDAAFRYMELVELEAEIPDKDDAPTPEEGAEFVGVEVLLPRRNGYQRAAVTQRKQSDDGELIGLCNTNPILDTRVYYIVLSVGEGLEVSENQVAESILTWCNTYGSEFIMFRYILYYWSDEKAIWKE